MSTNPFFVPYRGVINNFDPVPYRNVGIQNFQIMKKIERILAFVLFLVALTVNIAIGQDATGLPGDNFSLEGALELLQKSSDLESFEKNLNKSNNKVNNLDLNEDGDTDYIHVIDNIEGDAHAIVLQVAVSQSDMQDVAVIEIEKTASESAILQIVGDEDIYGEQMIVEPYGEEGSGGKGGPDADYAIVRVTVNVWLWSPVRAIYAPRYVRYVSPWRWSHYPNYWKPWRPLTWNFWHPHRYYYPSRYRVTKTHRVVVAHRVYTPVRTRSVVVRTRTTKVLATNGNRTVVRNYNNTKAVATNGKKKMAVNKNSEKVAATNGNKEVIANKKTGKAAMTNGNKKVYANKKTGKVVASNGKKTRATNSKVAKKKVGKKGKTANKKSKKAVKKKRG